MLLLLLTLLSSVRCSKSPHWVEACNGSYLFSEDLKTWFDARNNCELYGSKLVQINNMAENYCLLEYAQKQDMNVNDWFWHSGNDIEFEGVYRQADGGLILWQPLWWGNEPAGMGEDCLCVRLWGDNDAGRWIDNVCTNPHHYICER